MSLQNGLSALNLEMPDRIPRTEYSAHFHWDLVQKLQVFRFLQRAPQKNRQTHPVNL